MNILIKRLLTYGFRRSKRYRARNGLYVVLEYSFDKNQIDNISMGGLSFYYEDKGARPGTGSYELKIVGQDHQTLCDLPFINISDSEAGELIFQNRKVKRHSVQFGRLTSRHKNQLKFVLQEHTVST